MARTGGIDNQKNKNQKVKQEVKKDKKVVNKNNKNKLVIAIILVVLVVIAVIILTKKTDLSKIDDYSKLDANKYSKELLEEYDNEEGKKKFIEDYDYIQGEVGMYIMENFTEEEGSFMSIVNELNEELKKDNWEKIDYEKPKFWNGTYSVDDNGIVKFKFSNKNIEPSWKNDDDLYEKIIFN